MTLGNRTLLAPILMSEMVSHETTRYTTFNLGITDNALPMVTAYPANAGDYLVVGTMQFQSGGDQNLMIGAIAVDGVQKVQFHSYPLQHNDPDTQYLTSVSGFYWAPGLTPSSYIDLTARTDVQGEEMKVETNSSLVLAQFG